MKTKTIALALFAGLLATSLPVAAQAESYGKPCTTEPKEKWLSIEAIEKVVTDHGYEIAKTKVKGSCVEVYARDKQGTRVEYFIDPATGTPVGGDWKNSSK
jgi:hypothetical protein